MTTNHKEGGGEGQWEMRREGERPSNPTTRSSPAPAPSPVSHCLWGGLWVLAANDRETTSRGRRNNREMRRRMGK